MYRILVCERFSFQGNKVHFFEKNKTKNLCTIDQTRLKPLIQMN